MGKSGPRSSRQYDVVADARRRRSAEEKQAIIAEASGACTNVSAVARQHGSARACCSDRSRGRRQPRRRRSQRPSCLWHCRHPSDLQTMQSRASPIGIAPT